MMVDRLNGFWVYWIEIIQNYKLYKTVNNFLKTVVPSETIP